MVTYEELNAQIHKITELSNVLEFLLSERTLCDNGECCNLFYKYMSQVTEHMDVVDRNLYSELLMSSDAKLNNVAKSFMNGSVEIRRIMKEYASNWCNKSDKSISIGHKEKNYAVFLGETDEMFKIILDRLQKETEGLYPLIRELNEENIAA